ncbi:pyridoxal phosphate-dependent aminotransferase [Mycoplasmatota bacterium WC30]
MKLSKRILELQHSPIRKFIPIADKAKKANKKVYHLNIGQPDIETPKAFMDAIKNYESKVIKYSKSNGEMCLINAIQNFYKRENIIFEDDEILITNGASEALKFCSIAMCDVGDEILVPEPFYTNYSGFTESSGVKIVPITTKPEEGFRLPAKAEIVSLITPRTKVILFSNPGNPTGKILSLEEMEMLAEIAREHNLYIISDEVYRGISFDGLKAISMAKIKGIEDRVVVLESVSKRYSACGARIGSIQSKNKELIYQILKLCQARLCVATLEQVGAAELYRCEDTYIEEIKNEYEARRNIVFETLQNIPGIICEKPTGAFYIIAKLPIANAEKFVVWLLEEFDLDGETVMLTPAEAFYATEGLGVSEVRISYVLNTADLKKAMEILRVGLAEYIKK